MVKFCSKNLMACFFLFPYKKNSLERRNEVALFEHIDCWWFIWGFIVGSSRRLVLEAHSPSGRDVCLYSIVKSGTGPCGLYQLSALDFTTVFNYTVYTFFQFFSSSFFQNLGDLESCNFKLNKIIFLIYDIFVIIIIIRSSMKTFLFPFDIYMLFNN